MRFVKTIAIALGILFTAQANAQSKKDDEPITTRILFLLDGSGSMLAKWDGDLRINIAKKILSNLVDSLRSVPNLELAFRAYGHMYDKTKQNCKDTRLEVPFGPDNHDAIKKKLWEIKPKGVTPLAYSLEQATKDFTNPLKTRNVIIIITDGLESCDGDPCAISLALQKKNIFLKPFVIGIGMNENFANAFGCVGQFFNANDKNTFKDVLNRVMVQTLSECKIRVDLLDIYDEPTETNVNMTFLNRFTKQAQYDIVHKHIDGVSEEVEIDPILSYDIVVNTIPPVIEKNINITGGELNVIEIKTPQGSMKVMQQNHIEYGQKVDVIVRKRNKSPILYNQYIGDQVKYLVGKYDLEVMTLPRAIYKGVKIDQSKTTQIDVPRPGRLNIVEPIYGFASLYSVSDKGEKWIYNFPEKIGKTNIAIQPGKYKIVYRSKDAISNKYTTTQYFQITSGITTNVRMFKK